MRKTGLIILFLTVLVCSLFSQPESPTPTVSIEERNIRLDIVLDMINQQTGFDFSYNPNSIDPATLISVSFKNTSFEKVLNTLGKKIKADFNVIDDTVVILPKKGTELKEEETKLTLSGFISDEESGEILIGATVALAGTNRGVITNEFGFYSMQLEPGSYALVYSYIGYEHIEFSIELSSNKKKRILPFLSLLSIFLMLL